MNAEHSMMWPSVRLFPGEMCFLLRMRLSLVILDFTFYRVRRCLGMRKRCGQHAPPAWMQPAEL
jgi:hypothetical protein